MGAYNNFYSLHLMYVGGSTINLHNIYMYISVS